MLTKDCLFDNICGPDTVIMIRGAQTPSAARFAKGLDVRFLYDYGELFKNSFSDLHRLVRDAWFSVS